ncbi:MAG TPA: oligosaccharide flippase family protein [Chitinophagaceae bacterium]
MNAAGSGRKRTLVNFLSLSILQIGNYALPMITLPIISRIIGPEKYGAVNYAFAFAGYFILFINAGFDLYGTRQIMSYKGDQEKIRELFSRITYAKMLLCLVSSIVFVACLFSIEQLRAEILVNVFTYLMCLGWVFNPSWLYNGMQDSRRYAVFSFVSKLLFSVAVVLVVTERSDYIYHPLITSIAHLLVSGVSFVYAMRKYRLSLVPVSFRNILQTLRENRTLSLIWWITNQSSSTGIIVAGFILSTTDVGLYAAALRLVIIVQSILSMPLNTVLFPYIGEAFAEGYGKGIERVNKTLPYLVMLSLAMAGGTFILSGPLIYLFFGHEFGQSVMVLELLSVALLFSTVNTALGQQVMLHLKKDAAQIRFLLGGLLLNILLLVVFTSNWGITGAAVAWPLSEMVVFAAYLLYLRNQRVHVFEYSYYRPAYLFSNFMQMLRSKQLKKKAAAA